MVRLTRYLSSSILVAGAEYQSDNMETVVECSRQRQTIICKGDLQGHSGRQSWILDSDNISQHFQLPEVF